MGIFSNIFKDGKERNQSKNINWISLTNMNQLKEIKELSKTELIMIFKHSTRCGISSMVKRQFEELFEEEHQKIEVYYLDLLNYREISNAIASQFNIIHQSPQLLVIQNESVVFNASHYEITQVNLNKYIS